MGVTLVTALMFSIVRLVLGSVMSCEWDHSSFPDQLASDSVDAKVSEFFKSGHTNNWAVLVCTSRFWFNYRHVANVLSIYRSVKRFGIPDRCVNPSVTCEAHDQCFLNETVFIRY